MKQLILMLAMIGLSFTVQSCAGHTTKAEKLEARLDQQPVPAGTEELASESSTLIDQAAVTPEQKVRLHKLQQETRLKVAALQEQSLQLRALLIKTVINVTDTRDQMRPMKKKMKALEMEKINVIFTAVEQAHKILGHEARNNLRLMDSLTFGDKTHTY